MASSSSHSTQRRKRSQKRQPVARSTSSLFGTIKNIVTAPLTWFSATDDFEDKDSQGKRRRLVAAPAEPSSDDDERAARNKRMRIQSPPKHSLPAPYLDPPISVFYSEKRNDFPSIAHSELVSTIPDRPLAESRSTLSPMRHLSISRTMSIDPPVRPLSREASFTNQSLRDISMNNASFTRSRDLSMPPMPVSARPSFRMRTSMTPQPQQQYRELSEPPPINTLISNPIFIHGPPLQPSDVQQSTSTQTTLGSLVETVRVVSSLIAIFQNDVVHFIFSKTRSPIRQHSSLLFGATSNNDNLDSAFVTITFTHMSLTCCQWIASKAQRSGCFMNLMSTERRYFPPVSAQIIHSHHRPSLPRHRAFLTCSNLDVVPI